MMMLLCMACGGSGSGEEPTPEPGPDKPKVPSELEIYVYTPERPLVTRAGDDEVEPEAEEKAIHSLDIWVFVAETKTEGDASVTAGELVGHISPSVSADFQGAKYQMTVSENFGMVKPKVNVYVAANVKAANTGVSLGADTREAALTSAMLEGRYFGLTASSIVTTVPDDGLPMTGVLKNQEVTGNAPALKVPTAVKVVRTMSKIRFVFCRTEVQDLSISGISLDEGVIPTQEYLFLDNAWTADKSHVGSTYEASASLSPLRNEGRIPVCAWPAKYSYTGELSNQEYENLINSGIEAGELGQVGRFYLRETDKEVKGKIHYRIDSGEEKTASFAMGSAGGFTRNHTWIVYGFFAGKENLEVFSVKVTDWTETQGDHQVHNW